MSEPRTIRPHEGTLLRVRDAGQVLVLDYDGAMTAHAGSLWWGTAVAFRAMQVAAATLSAGGELWSRDDLYCVTGHPGGGVRDAVNYVTRVVDRDRYNVVVDGGCGMKCHSSMTYDWWLSDGVRTAAIRLRPDFVPAAFYTLMDRLGTPDTTPADKLAFEIFKVNLSAKIWNYPLMESFSAELIEQPLAAGTLPAVMLAPDYWDNVKALQAVRA